MKRFVNFQIKATSTCKAIKDFFLLFDCQFSINVYFVVVAFFLFIFENSEFIVSLDNSRAMSALTFLLFKLNTLHTHKKVKNRQTLSPSKPWCNDSGVLTKDIWITS